MKKKMIALLAGALLTMAASNAMAAFGNADLVRVVYNRTGSVEVATDLGSINSLLAGGAVAADTFNLSQITGATSSADLYVAYFASNYNGLASTSTAYIGANAPITMNSYNNYNNAAAQTINNYYNSLSTGAAGATTVLGQQAYTNSYVSLLDKGGLTNGLMAGTIIAGNAEQNLATLLASGGNTTIYSVTGLTGRNTVTGTATNLVLATNFNTATGIGSTSLVPAATPTPIPAAAYLLGSGLLGLVGIRRKQK